MEYWDSLLWLTSTYQGNSYPWWLFLKECGSGYTKRASFKSISVSCWIHQWWGTLCPYSGLLHINRCFALYQNIVIYIECFLSKFDIFVLWYINLLTDLFWNVTQNWMRKVFQAVEVPFCWEKGNTMIFNFQVSNMEANTVICITKYEQ